MAKINITKLTKTRYSAHVKATAEEKEVSDRKAFENIRSKVKIDGFRNGKVPEHIVRTRYAADIEDSSIQSLIEMTSGQLIKEADKDIYRIRKVENMEPQKAGFSFDIIFDTQPEINLGKMKGLVIKENIPIIDEKDIQKEIKELQKSFAERKSRGDDDYAREGDLLIVSYEQWSDGIPAGEPANGIQVYLGELRFDEEIEKKLIEEKPLKDSEHRFSKNVPQKDGAEKKIDIVIHINQIYEIIWPELTDELAQKYDSEYKNVRELREDISKTLYGRFHRKNMDMEIGSLLDQLNELAEVELPEQYVEERLQKYLDENQIELQNFPEKERDEFKKIFEKETRKKLVNEHVLKESMRELKGEDYRNGFLKFVEDNFDKRMVRTFKLLYDDVLNKNENNYSSQFVEKLLHLYHLNILEKYFREKGFVKKDKKIAFADFFKETNGESV